VAYDILERFGLVLKAIVKKRLNKASLYTLLRIFSVTLFEEIPFKKDFLDGNNRSADELFRSQLTLFNFEQEPSDKSTKASLKPNPDTYP